MKRQIHILYLAVSIMLWCVLAVCTGAGFWAGITGATPPAALCGLALAAAVPVMFSTYWLYAALPAADMMENDTLLEPQPRRVYIVVPADAAALAQPEAKTTADISA